MDEQRVWSFTYVVLTIVVIYALAAHGERESTV